MPIQPLPSLADPALFYAAVAAFLAASIFVLWQRVQQARRRHAETPISERLDKAVHYFWANKRRKKITNDTYQELTGVSHATATRDLSKLEEIGLLEQRGRTRGAYYLVTPKAGRHTAKHKKSTH